MKLNRPSDTTTAYNRAPALDIETAWNPASAPQRTLGKRLLNSALSLTFALASVTLVHSCQTREDKAAPAPRPASSAHGPAPRKQ